MDVNGDAVQLDTGRRLILHVGAEKTGTSSFQAAAAMAHGESVWSPHHDLGGLDMPVVAYAFGTHERLPDVVRFVERRFGPMDVAEARARVRRAVDEQSDLPVILSCEYLYSRFDGEEYRQLNAFLRDIRPDLDVVCVLRDARTAAAGLVVEALKTGNPARSPEEVFTGSYGFDGSGYFDVATKCAELADGFGGDLTLLRYEDLLDAGGTVAGLFAAMQLAADDPAALADIRVNSRLNRRQGQALRRLNRATTKLERTSLPLRVGRRFAMTALAGDDRPFEPLVATEAFQTAAFQERLDAAQGEIDAIFES